MHGFEQGEKKATFVHRRGAEIQRGKQEGTEIGRKRTHRTQNRKEQLATDPHGQNTDAEGEARISRI